MAACTFFGHRECHGVDIQVLRQVIEVLIGKGVDTFYVGNQGQFDSMVYSCLKQLRKDYPHIRVCVVLAYLPAEQRKYDDMEDTMFPEIEGHPKFANKRKKACVTLHEPKPKGRPRKDGQPPRQDIQKELERLRMENKLLQDFLQSTERM